MQTAAARAQPRLSYLDRLALEQLDLGLSAAITIADTPPSEFRLFGPGKNPSSKGEYLFDAESAASVMADYREHAQVDLPLDYGHAMLNDEAYPDPAEAGKAAGWFVPEIRQTSAGPELWATNVRYTPSATKKLTDKEYRHFSPAFAHKKGHILRLVNVAITNIPAQHGQLPLVRASATAADDQETTVPFRLVMQRLNLAENATEAEALEALSRMAERERKVLEAIGAKNADEALGVLTAWKGSHEKVATLTKELETLRLESAQRQVRTLVRKGIEEGKITPANKKTFAEMPIEALKAFLKTAKPVVEIQRPGKKNKGHTERRGDTGGDETELTAEEIEVAKHLGTDLVQLKKRKALGVRTGELKMTTPKKADKDDDEDAGDDE